MTPRLQPHGLGASIPDPDIVESAASSWLGNTDTEKGSRVKMHEGSCHCGAVKVTLRTQKTAAELGARSCQCSFCKAHGASWTSDPAGELSVKIAGSVSPYRLGTGSAEFLVCATCGVVPAVIREADGRLLGVVRVECLPERDALLAHATRTDLDDELLAQRLVRRSHNWTPVNMTVHCRSSAKDGRQAQRQIPN